MQRSNTPYTPPASDSTAETISLRTRITSSLAWGCIITFASYGASFLAGHFGFETISRFLAWPSWIPVKLIMALNNITLTQMGASHQGEFLIAFFVGIFVGVLVYSAFAFIALNRKRERA
jgi:hypothetical protein